MMEKFQSTYRPHHNTETALVRVLNEFTVYLDHGKTCLALLDLSAALIDTISTMINI